MSDCAESTRCPQESIDNPLPAIPTQFSRGFGLEHTIRAMLQDLHDTHCGSSDLTHVLDQFIRSATSHDREEYDDTLPSQHFLVPSQSTWQEPDGTGTLSIAHNRIPRELEMPPTHLGTERGGTCSPCPSVSHLDDAIGYQYIDAPVVDPVSPPIPVQVSNRSAWFILDV
jgi:hypothetical protein